MNRYEFRKSFNTDQAVILPVIHVTNVKQTVWNIECAVASGCHGVFLINHDFGIDQFLPIVSASREQFPEIWLGINFLATTGKDAFPVLAELEKEGIWIDGYWADDARIDEFSPIDQQAEATEILDVKKQVSWNGMYFGGTAFKKQREIDPTNYAVSAEIACKYMDVVTTSGVATGKAADTTKIATFRKACGDTAIALASGITPENVHHYADLVDCLMVATGINIEGDFYNIDLERLKKLFERLSGVQK